MKKEYNIKVLNLGGSSNVFVVDIEMTIIQISAVSGYYILLDDEGLEHRYPINYTIISEIK